MSVGRLFDVRFWVRWSRGHLRFSFRVPWRHRVGGCGGAGKQGEQSGYIGVYQRRDGGVPVRQGEKRPVWLYPDFTFRENVAAVRSFMPPSPGEGAERRQDDGAESLAVIASRG